MASTFMNVLSGSAVAALLAAGALASAVPVSAAGPATAGLEYVALGDSYAAGYGLEPLTLVPVPGCLQSSSNYPHQLAAALGMNLNDRTCSGATTANILTTPQDTSGLLPDGGIAPIQIASLSASTDVITISIGGNDLGFAPVAQSCVALSATGPVYNPPTYSANCKDIYFPSGGPDQLAEKLANVVTPALANTFAAVKAAAPNAKVFVVSYPTIAPDAANTPSDADGCFTSAIPNGFQPPFAVNSFPFTLVDVPYLHDVEKNLDAAIQAKATEAGFTYIPVFSQTAEHSACEDAAEAYVNGISIESLTLDPASVTVARGALHPNLVGATFMADQTLPVIAAAFPPHALAATGTEPSPTLAIAAFLALLGGVTLVLARRLNARRD